MFEFFPDDEHVVGGFDSDADASLRKANHRDGDLVANQNPFTHLSGQDEHRATSAWKNRGDFNQKNSCWGRFRPETLRFLILAVTHPFAQLREVYPASTS